jgi:hypothetical protein
MRRIGLALVGLAPALCLGVLPAEARPVASMDELRQAVAEAQPGEVIEMAPGTYALSGRQVDIRRPGSRQAPITLRGHGTVILEVTTVEGFAVAAPYWRFENLEMHGACAEDGDCEHAFHIVGPAKGVTIRNSHLIDFNAAIKVNGADGAFPDFGLIENTVVANTRARRTGNPVTGIDIVAASGWVVRGSLIADFAKDGGNRVSYGAFMKGGGEGGVFENNLVVCSRVVPGKTWQEERIGLSFGGGGTDKAYCRDGACAYEHRGGTLRNNVVQDCSDVGIYLNHAPSTRILHDTVIRTRGIDVRFADSSAVIRNSVVDGRVRERDGGRAEVTDRPDRLAEAPTDFCGRPRPPAASAGAVETTLPGCDPQALARR